MDILFASLTVLAGFLALIGGGELLVRSSSILAAAAGISPVVTGLTVVAFATSAPELAVVIQSAYAGKTDLAIGNAVGSNIFNVLFVLGLSAIVAPLVVKAQLIRWDVPVMIGASALLLLFSLDGVLGRIDGLVMFGLLVGYITWTIIQSRKAEKEVKAEFAAEYAAEEVVENPRLGIQCLVFLAGLGLLVLGANLAVVGSVEIATSFGVSELIIGLTVVAVGTSLPEVVTSMVASYRGERDIAVGNVVGSNMFNILAVLGLSSIVAPGGIAVTDNAIRFDIPVMIAVAIACLPIFYIGHKIARWEGFVLFGYYLAYTAYLILDAKGHAYAKILEGGLVLFVIPLTVLTFLIGVYRYWRRPGEVVEGAETSDEDN